MTEDAKDNLLNSNFFAINDPITSDTPTTVSQFDNSLFVNPAMTVEGQCIYTTALSAELGSSFPAGTILQILPDNTILAVPSINNSSSNDSTIFKSSSFPTSLLNDQNTTNVSNLLTPSNQNEGNMSDIDLSFLTETEESVTTSKNLNESEVKELQTMIDIVEPDSLGMLQNNPCDVGSNLELSQAKQQSPKPSEGPTEDLVMIDVSKPIQLSQNSLIMVNGRKCILQQDTETGQVIAYPVKEPDKPRRKRGRPRKPSAELVDRDESVDANITTADISEEEKEKGLLEVVNDDGSLVRRSSRKRKKAKVLKDYETGNLKQELGSDVEDVGLLDDFEIQNRKKKHKGPGRPKKCVLSQKLLTSDAVDESKRPRGRPRKQSLEKEPTQAFLVQTADGQTLMMQVPLSSIPVGVSLQEVAQNIANRLNIGLNMTNNNLGETDVVQNNSKSTDSEILLDSDCHTDSVSSVEPAVQDHSIGSTTNLQNSNQLVDEENQDIADSSSNVIYNLEEVIVDSVCESEEVNEVPGNKPNSYLAETILEKHFSNGETVPSDNNFSANVSTTNQSSIESASIISSLPTQLCVGQSGEQDLVNTLSHEQFAKDFLIDGDFLKDKVNIHMLLQNVEASTEESIPDLKLQSCTDINTSVLQDELHLESTIPYKFPSQAATGDKSSISEIQETSNFSDSGKNLENYKFFNYTITNFNNETNNDAISRNHAIISSIEHDHDFQIQGRKLSNVSESQTPSSTSKLTFIDSEINSKTQTSSSILPIENFSPIIRMTPVDDDMNLSTASVIPVSELQQESEKILPIILTSQKEIKSNKCKVCHKLLDSEEELIQHFKANHPKCICSHCNYMAEHAYVIKRHSLRHLNSGCICKLCGKRYKDHYILKMHIKMVHLPAEALFTCDICNKTFTRKAHLKRHLRIHEPNRPYKCAFCNYRGCERSDITKHLLVHETPKHKCQICGKSFRHTKNMELHLKRHYKQRDYKCGICDFYGYTFTDIRKHIERRHAGAKYICCTDCGLLFKNIEALEVHKNSGHCQICLLEQESTTKDTASEDKKVLEDLPLDMLEVTEHTQENNPSAVEECEGVKLESESVILNPVDGVLNSSQNEQLVMNGFEASDFLNAETLSLVSAKGDSDKMITIVSPNGKTFPIPIKTKSSDSLDNVLASVSRSNEVNFFLTEIEAEL